MNASNLLEAFMYGVFTGLLTGTLLRAYINKAARSVYAAKSRDMRE